MRFLVLCFLPLCCAYSGSHVTVTLGDSTYSHGDMVPTEHKEMVPTAGDSTNMLDMMHTATKSNSASGQESLNAAPVYFSSTPASSYTATPLTYHPAPIRYLPNPVVVSKPHNYLHHPLYHNVPVHHRHNCSVETEIATAEVC